MLQGKLKRTLLNNLSTYIIGQIVYKIAFSCLDKQMIFCQLCHILQKGIVFVNKC